jgi:hypothetical protein
MFTSKANASYATANAFWKLIRPINSAFPEGHLPRPSWAPSRLPKQRDRMPMDTGVPRKTLSLCPDCNHEAVISPISGITPESLKRR